MSFGANQSSGSSQSQSQSYYDPDIKAGLLGNYNRALDLVNGAPMTPYTGALSADFSNTSLPDAINAASAGAAFQPQSVAASAIGASPGVAATTVNAGTVNTPGSVSGAQIGAYLNPYTDDVTAVTAQQLARQNAIDNAGAAAQATAAGAFGGSRSAVLQNLNTDSYQRNLGQVIGNLQSQGYNTALGAAQTDLARGLQAQMANQSAGLQAGIANQSAALQAGIANQNTATQTGIANQNNSLQAGVDNQNADLQAASLRNTATGLLGQYGQAQQTQQQDALNAAYQEWLRQQNYPIQMQQLLNQSAGLLPNGPLTTSNSTNTTDSTGFNVGLPTSWTTPPNG